MSRCLISLALVLALGAGAGRARASGCPPAAGLDGDPALVAAVAELLRQRGIGDGGPGCPTVPATIGSDGPQVRVLITPRGGGAVERVVADVAAAATAIESFVRTDLDAPLLRTRALPRAATPVDAPIDVGPGAPAADRGRTVQVFAALETSFASDHTTWMGAQLGVCVRLGRVCAAARLRAAAVTAAAWDDQIERRGTELLLGIDIPFTVRGLVVSPGFAAGLGQIHTRASREMRAETGGPRADVHATVSRSLGHGLRSTCSPRSI